MCREYEFGHVILIHMLLLLMMLMLMLLLLLVFHCWRCRAAVAHSVAVLSDRIASGRLNMGCGYCWS